MTPAFLVLLVGATTFLEQDIAGLEVGPPNPRTGTVSGQFRRADLDGDGAVDLVLPQFVMFQRDHAFRRGNRVAIPYANERPWCDVWERQVALQLGDRLVMLQWDAAAGDWAHALKQDIAWPVPEAVEEAGQLPAAAERGLRFRDFLHDMDGDGQPEIVASSPRGIHVFAREGDFYAERACLPVLPPFRFSYTPQRLWPPAGRAVAFPSCVMGCRFFIEGAQVHTVASEYLGEGEVRFRVTSYRLDPANGYAVVGGEADVHETAPMPDCVEPCRLNGDGIIDYAGADGKTAASSVLPVPVYRTVASTDGGATYRAVRTQSFGPQCCFVDFDGDGDLDMVTEPTRLFDEGVRESLTRLSARRSIEHEVEVWYQDETGAFSSAPDVRSRFLIRLDRPPIEDAPMLTRYKSGELVDITGDFNGDGRRDAVIQDRPDRLALFLTTESGFPRRPTATLQIRDEWRFSVADIDGDGRSDIVVRWADPAGRALSPDGGGQRTRVFLVRDAGS
ncbi:MAG: VCBS repeat-containing protein [Candidatus Hydrogenedentes bacterium]|nr:VCBS repeat-containing protein [Candidatus Hydrogenedentota bacterium]